MGKKPDKQPPHLIKLTDLPRTLAGSGVTASYAQLYNAAVNGTIPVERSLSGSRWVLPADKLPVVIQKFSLMKD